MRCENMVNTCLRAKKSNIVCTAYIQTLLEKCNFNFSSNKLITYWFDCLFAYLFAVGRGYKKDTQNHEVLVGYLAPVGTSTTPLLHLWPREHCGRGAEILQAWEPGCLLLDMSSKQDRDVSTMWMPEQDLHGEMSWYTNMDGGNFTSPIPPQMKSTSNKWLPREEESVLFRKYPSDRLSSLKWPVIDMCNNKWTQYMQ